MATTSSDKSTDAEHEALLWKELTKRNTVMLGLTAHPMEHMQPMTAFRDDSSRSVFFFVRTDNDLAKRAGSEGGMAMMCLQSKDDSFIACVSGELKVAYDRERIERFWNPVVAAWYPEGKDDPALTLLRFDPADAQLWIADSNPVKFGWEIAKSNMTKRLPDIGETAHLDL
jgi:general stress protein 26